MSGLYLFHSFFSKIDFVRLEVCSLSLRPRGRLSAFPRSVMTLRPVRSDRTCFSGPDNALRLLRQTAAILFSCECYPRDYPPCLSYAFFFYFFKSTSRIFPEGSLFFEWGALILDVLFPLRVFDSANPLRSDYVSASFFASSSEIQSFIEPRRRVLHSPP